MSSEDERPPGTPSHGRPSAPSPLQFIAGFSAAVALTVAIPIVVGVAGAMLSELGVKASEVLLIVAGGSALLFGVTQLLWNLPVALLLWRAGKRSAMLGVLLAAGLLFLLNAACFGLLLGASAWGSP